MEKQGTEKLKQTRKRMAETEIRKQLSHSAVLCSCVYIAYYTIHGLRMLYAVKEVTWQVVCDG